MLALPASHFPRDHDVPIVTVVPAVVPPLPAPRLSPCAACGRNHSPLPLPRLSADPRKSAYLGLLAALASFFHGLPAHSRKFALPPQHSYSPKFCPQDDRHLLICLVRRGLYPGLVQSPPAIVVVSTVQSASLCRHHARAFQTSLRRGHGESFGGSARDCRRRVRTDL